MKNKIIRGCIVEITLCLIFLVASVLIWNRIDMSYYKEIAKSYEHYGVVSKK